MKAKLGFCFPPPPRSIVGWGLGAGVGDGNKGEGVL